VNLNGKRILVTGGAGFIGSHIVDDLLRRGAEVRVYDNFSSGFRENLRHVERDIEIIEGDVLDLDSLERACEGCDAISHQAAQLEIIKCIETPIEDLRVNAEGTLNVLECARRLDIGKVVYASSACVYGQAKQVPQPEEHPLRPNWPYGVSKLAAEHYARLSWEYYGIRTIGLRYSIVYGPREWFGRVLTVFLERALDGEPPVLWGGHQQRDFVYVEDIARLHTACLEEDGTGAEVFNGSTGIGTSIRELAELVCERFDLPDPIEEAIAEGEESTLVSGRMRLPAELQRMILDSTKAHSRFGWTPETRLPDGLEREMEWLRDHRERWVEMHY